MATTEVLRGQAPSSRLELTPLQNVVYRALVHMLGTESSEAVDFFVDTRLATHDPERYEQAIRLLLGEHGGGLVIQGIKTELAMREGRQINNKESFASYIRTYERVLVRTR